MPIIDVLVIACAWCGTERGVFRCHGCVKPTCRECQVQVGEDGSCEHKPYVAPDEQGWGTGTYSSILLPSDWTWALFETASGHKLLQAHVLNIALHWRNGVFDWTLPLIGATRCNLSTDGLKLRERYMSYTQQGACPRCWELVSRS